MAKRISTTGTIEFLYQFQNGDGFCYNVWASSQIEAAKRFRESFSN